MREGDDVRRGVPASPPERRGSATLPLRVHCARYTRGVGALYYSTCDRRQLRRDATRTSGPSCRGVTAPDMDTKGQLLKTGHKETPDLTIKRKKYKMDLIPPALVVARYFAAEQANVED